MVELFFFSCFIFLFSFMVNLGFFFLFLLPLSPLPFISISPLLKNQITCFGWHPMGILALPFDIAANRIG
jgi:hypothetical protein